MSQLHFYVSDEIEAQIRDKAKRSNLALYVASKKTVARNYCKSYFPSCIVLSLTTMQPNFMHEYA